MISTTQAAAATRPDSRPPSVSPGDFGAVGDGIADDTDALQAAVDAAAGRGLPVRLIGGTFLCGTLRLRGGTTLVVEPGATIRGTGDLDRYHHFVRPDGNGEPQGDRWHRALVLIENASDVRICGGGTIDGDDVFDAHGEAGMRGPHLILVGSSRRVRVEGVTLRDAANYAILSEFSHDVEARDLRILGGWDGLHVRGDVSEPATKISLIDCDVRTGDDCVAIKYADDFAIIGCRLNSSCNAVRAIGPVTRLTIRGNLFHGPGHHPHRKQMRHNMLGGVVLQPGTWDKTRGRVDGVLLADNVMRDLKCVMQVVTTPGNDFGRIDVLGLTATGVYGPAMSFRGRPDFDAGHVTLRDVFVRYAKEAVRRQVPPPAPPASRGVWDLAAWGLVAEHLASFSAERVEMNIDGDDVRPERVVSDVGRAAARAETPPR